MIVEYIRYTIPPAQREAFEHAYDVAQTSLQASEYCLTYDLARSTADVTRYILRIVWDSAEGHLHGFRSSPQFRSFFQAVRPFVGQIEEMTHYELTTVVGKR